jgi:C4-dicarboxylate transporter DctM subunit
MFYRFPLNEYVLALLFFGSALGLLVSGIPIWFAVIMTVNLEIGLVTPPVGLNLYVAKSIAPEIPMAQVLLGVTPFVIIDCLVIVILCIWPELALWLPNKMIG